MSILILSNHPKFPLGQLVITAQAQDRLEPSAIHEGLSRHAGGDWGEVPPEDQRENEHSLKAGNRLFSAYGSGEGRFWIITEADRSATTVLLPQEY